MRVLDQSSGSGKHRFSGFDISPASFPDDAPPNFSFHLLDARQPCPAAFAGKFDIVHIRLLVGGMGHDDWARAARCSRDMLKSGGALMWTELRLRDSVPALRVELDATDKGLSKLNQRFLDIVGERLDGGVPTLEKVLAEVSEREMRNKHHNDDAQKEYWTDVYRWV